MSSLRTVISTGSVLTKEQYEWFYQDGFPKHTQLISMSGGTDIAGCCTWIYFLIPDQVNVILKTNTVILTSEKS
jgi:acyl-coenzyme A synthetase/AMP-(fatty) acid ligase